MRSQQATKTTLGFCFLLLFSWFVSFSKAYVPSILADAQTVQEGSPTWFFSQKSLDKEQLVKAQTQFGFNLFSTLAKDNNGQNIFISPASIALTLSMLYNGASGKTQQEIANVLTVQNLDIDTLNQANQALETELDANSRQGELAVATSVWARQGFAFRYQFLKDNREYYNAQITNLNFANSESIGIINRWVRENTQETIQEIIEQINPNDILLVMNASYFSGSWQTEFDKNLTTEKPFNLLTGKTKKYPFMSREGKYSYFENSKFQAVKLPYGKGRFSLYLMLPKTNQTLRDILQGFTVDEWKKILTKFDKKQGLVKLPRFTLNFEVDLKKSLKSLGVSTMFSPSEARFSGLTSHQVHIDSVKHKTLLEINEQGTKSGGMNSMGFKAITVLPSERQFSMILDHPFFCTIQDNKTGAILFMGAIVDPQ